MKHVARSALFLLVVPLIPASAIADPACVPDPNLSSVEPWDSYGKVFVSPGTQSGVDEVTVTVLCLGSIPSVNANVEIRFLGCDDLCFYDPADSEIRGLTDASGQFVFDPSIGGCDDCYVRVYVDGVFLAEYTEVVSTDWDGTEADGAVNGDDEAWITPHILTGSSEPCADYNGDGAAGLFESTVFSLANGVDFEPGCGQCFPFQRTYTLDADFQDGTIVGLTSTGDELNLPAGAGGLGTEFAWLANSGEGTVSKINTDTGDEVARYYTGPPLGGSHARQSPSRVVIDDEGNCWVANRAFGYTASVTQILHTGGVDRDGNGSIATSVDLSGDGIIQNAEVLAWGADERVVRHYLVGTGGADNVARALVLDRAGFLWVGLYNGYRVIKFRTDLSTATYAPDATPAAPPEEASVNTGCAVYGLALSCNGLLYGTNVSTIGFEVDPGLSSGGTALGPALTQVINTPQSHYGIACDASGIVWMSARSGGVGFVRWDPDATWTVSDPSPFVGRGVTVDFAGNVWKADDLNNTVSVFGPGGGFIDTYPAGVMEPVGLGVARDGNIIVIGKRSWSWTKINSTTGDLIPLAGPQRTGSAPYSYTDFTGNLRSSAAQKQGAWRAVTDGGHSGLLWDTISWNAATPAGTTVEIEARAASSLAQLALLNWTPVTVNGIQPAPLPGRYLETQATLSADVECGVPTPTPTLFDLTVEAVCDTCYFVSCPTDTVVMCQIPQGAVVEYPTPYLDAGCDPSYTVSCSPPSGSLFPMGSTTVTCTATDQHGNNVICEFVVLVNGECNQDYAGACCLEGSCFSTSELYCDIVGGVYYGSAPDCDIFCDYTGWDPDWKLASWWALDRADAHGYTANLADPYSQGRLVGGVTQVPGDYVGNSYEFDGATGYVDVLHRTTLDPGSSDFAMCLWVRTGVAGDMPLIDKRQSGAPVRGFRLFLSGGYPALELATGGGGVLTELSAGNGGASAFVADGAWHLVAVSVDRDEPDGIRFHVDGSQVGTTFDPTPAQGDLSASANLLLGRSHPLGGPATYFTGGMDEVMVFGRTLSAGEIDGLWQEGSAGMRRESICSRTVASTGAELAGGAISVCNHDDVPHLYSYGISAAPDPGSGIAVENVLPSAGSLTVNPGECLPLPVSFESPSQLAPGASAGYRVTLFNHDTGHLSEHPGTLRLAGKWNAVFQEQGGGAVPPIRELEFEEGALGFDIEVAHVEDVGGTVPLDFVLLAVSADGDTSRVLSVNGLPPGAAAGDTVQVAGDGTPLIIPFTLEYLEPQQIAFDRVLLMVDEDSSGTRSPIAEMAVRMQPVPLVGLGVPDDGDGPGPDAAIPARLRTLPNPFSASGLIEFEVLHRPEKVRLRAYDLAGRLVKEILPLTEVGPGLRRVTWDGTDGHGTRLPGGVYYLRLEAGDRVTTAKMVLIR